MRLNKQGYMLVEIVLASVLAMSIAYYLLNLTYKFKNTDQDIYQSIFSISDRNIITKNIMNDMEEGTISNINYTPVDTTSIQFNITKNITNTDTTETTTITEPRRLSIDKSNGTILKYGKYTSGVYDTKDVSYYEKKISNSMIVDKMNIVVDNENKILTILIPITSIYGDEKYDIKLFISNLK